MDDYVIGVFTNIGLISFIALSAYLLLVAGEMSFGQQGFFGVGAYTAGVATAMYGTWETAKVDIHEIVGGEEWGVVVLTLTMTSKRTGRTFSQTVNEAGRFKDGILQELRIHYFDAAEVAAEA